MCQDHSHPSSRISRRRFVQASGAGLLASGTTSASVRALQPTPGPFKASADPVRVSENLYLLEDTCNVYLIKDRDRGLLIDFGSGRMLEVAGDLGISQLDWVLHTHHHRDQAQGDHRAVERRIPIAVPAHERHLFEDSENFWRNRRINHIYQVRNDFFTLTRNVPVAELLHDYGTFRWGSCEFQILPTPGHTPGSISLVTEIDGRKVAFTGDLIHSPGKVKNLFDLQYNYGSMDGVDLCVYSLTRLKELKPQLVCPSHGAPMQDPAPGIEELIGKLTSWYDYWHGPRMITQSRPIGVSPHLVAHAQTTSSFYAVISDSGKALFLDYGSASGPTFSSMLNATDTLDRIRFVEHSIDELRAHYGLRSIDVVMPSHMHDDHINGFPHLVRHYDTKVWCYQNMKEILENPRGRNLGCVLPEPVKVERTMGHRETFRWEEFEFTVVHSPGHTEYQMALLADIDGTRVAFTGDAFFNNPANPDDGLRHNLIYRNDVMSDSHLRSLRNILDFEPNIIAPGHGAPFLLNRDDALRFEKRLLQQQDHFDALVADPDTDFGLDPSWVHIYPYQGRILPGESASLEVRFRNHRQRPLEAETSLVLPEGWSCTPSRGSLTVPARGKGSFEFTVSVPGGAGSGLDRVAIAADVVADGTYLGQLAEAVVDLRKLAF